MTKCSIIQTIFHSLLGCTNAAYAQKAKKTYEQPSKQRESLTNKVVCGHNIITHTDASHYKLIWYHNHQALKILLLIVLSASVIKLNLLVLNPGPCILFLLLLVRFSMLFKKL